MNELEIGIAESWQPTIVIALIFNCNGQDRKEVVHSWAAEILERQRAKYVDVDSILLRVSLQTCGGQALYRTVDDIPLVDVPCPCGDPNHWLIKYQDS